MFRFIRVNRALIILVALFISSCVHVPALKADKPEIAEGSHKCVPDLPCDTPKHD